MMCIIKQNSVQICDKLFFDDHPSRVEGDKIVISKKFGDKSYL